MSQSRARLPGGAAAGWLAAAALLVTGCSSLPRVDLQEAGMAASTRHVIDAPAFVQDAYQCGPAALAGVLSHAGVPSTPESLVGQVFLPGRQGSLQAELKAATRRAGLIPFEVTPRLDTLLAEVDAGHPVLVLQNLQTRSFPRWHYSVVVGYDTPENRILLNNGESAAVAVPASRFLRTWEWADRWGFVALAPGQMSTDVDARTYLATVADFEAVAGAAAASPAWAAGIERWPDVAELMLAAGNTALETGQTAEAVAYYRRGLAIDSRHVPMSNNLAHALGQLGCPRQGEALLVKMQEWLGESPWSEALESTRAELARQPGRDAAACG